MNNRNYGIDLLRIISMFYVIVLHVLGQGGVLWGQLDVPHYWVSWAIEAFVYCAVDCFGLISGYVAYRENNTKLKLSAYFSMWLQVVFYGLLITLIYSFLMPGRVGVINYLRASLPVTLNRYWYFTAYTGLVLVMPLINAAVQKSEDNILKKTAILIIMLFSCYSAFIAGYTDRFHLHRGYSFIWLAILYFIGAVIKKTGLFTDISKRKALFTIIFFTAFSILWRAYASYIPFIGSYLSRVSFILYISPTVLGTSIIHLVMFARYNPPSRIIPAIRFAAPGAFAAYLINTQPYVWNYFMANRFVFLCDASIYYLPAVTFIFAAFFVFISIFIDRLRQELFRTLRIEKLTVMAESLIYRSIEHFL